MRPPGLRPPGNLVEVHSLAKSKELNGRGGEVLEYHADARRYSVRVMVAVGSPLRHRGHLGIYHI